MDTTDKHRDKSHERPPYVWDYDISWEEFHALLKGSHQLGRLDQDWAAVRLIEYAPYEEMIRLLGYRSLMEGWPRWRQRVRAHDRSETHSGFPGRLDRNLPSGTAGLCRLFLVTYQDWELVRWITPPDSDEYIREVKQFAENLLLPE